MKLLNLKFRKSSSASTTESVTNNNIRQCDKVVKLST